MTITGEQRITLIATLVVTVGILVWDWFLLRDGVPGNTISAAVRAYSSCLPVPLIFGVWMSHMFWYLPGHDSQPWSWLRLVFFAGAVLASWAWWECSDDRARLWFSANPQVTFVVGFISGHWLWPQFTGNAGS